MGNRPNDSALGQRLREAREHRGLTQAALARRLGVPYQLVQHYERGRAEPDAQRLKLIATELKTPVFMATY